MYRSKSEYESTAEKQHYDSYKDFLTHQNSLELSLNFKDTISAPMQLEPKEIIPPLTSQNQTQKKLDYETSSSSLQRDTSKLEDSLDPIKSLKPLMLPLRVEEEEAKIVESKSTRHSNEPSEIFAKLRRSSTSDRVLSRDAGVGGENSETKKLTLNLKQTFNAAAADNSNSALPEGDIRSRQHWGQTVSHSLHTKPMLGDDDESRDMSYINKSSDMHGYSEKPPCKWMDKEVVGGVPQSSFYQGKDYSSLQEEPSLTPQRKQEDFKGPLSQSSLSISSSSPPDKDHRGFYESNISLSNYNADSTQKEKSCDNYDSSPPPAPFNPFLRDTPQKNNSSIGSVGIGSVGIHNLPPPQSEQKLEREGMLDYDQSHFFYSQQQRPGTQNSEPIRPDSGLASNYSGGFGGQQTFRAPERSNTPSQNLHHSFSNSTLQGFPTNLIGYTQSPFELPMSSPNASMNIGQLPMTPILGPSPPPGEVDKNCIILQYEYIVQQLNIQVKKLLERNEQYERTLQIERNTPRPEQNIIATLERKLDLLETNNQKLDQELQMTRKLHQEGTKGIQELRDNNKSASSQLDYLKNQLGRSNRGEQEARQKMEEAQQKAFQLELVIQKKDEEIFQTRQDHTSVQSEMRHLQQIQQSLQMELSELHGKRQEQETINQELRKQLYSSQMLMRAMQNENQNYKMEKASLLSNQEMLQKNLQEVAAESMKLKSSQTGAEHEKLIDRQMMDRLERENQRLQRELSRMNNLVQLQKSAFNDLQRDYQNAVGCETNSQGASAPLPTQSSTMAVRPQTSIEPGYAEIRGLNKHGEMPQTTDFSNYHSQNMFKPPVPGPFNTFHNRSQSVGGRQEFHTFRQPPNAFRQNSGMGPDDTFGNLGGGGSSFMGEQKSVGGPGYTSPPSELNQQKYDEFRRRQNSSSMVGSLLQWNEQDRMQQNHEGSQQNLLNFYKVKEVQANTTPLVTFPSYEKYERQRQAIEDIEHKIQELIEVKKKLENDYCKVPAKGKRGSVQRKQQIEQQLDSTDRSIHSLKQKLRELNAYHIAG